MLITFEGCEGSGKSTQAQMLHQAIARLPDAPTVLLTRQPGGTELGQAIRSMLLHGGEVGDRAELLLYAADRAHHVDTVIRPALERGEIVICDRYIDSTAAYQGFGRGIDLGQINLLNWIATGDLDPDLTLWLNLPAEAGLSRIKGRGRDRMEQSSLEFHQRVQAGYEALHKTWPDRIVAIDATLPVQRVAELCYLAFVNARSAQVHSTVCCCAARRDSSCATWRAIRSTSAAVIGGAGGL